MSIDQRRTADVPIPGFYATKLVKGGPEVGCRIVFDAGLWVVLVSGVPTSESAKAEPWRIPWMERCAFSRRISENEYETLIHAAATARPGEPAASPLQPVRWRDAPSLY